MSAAQEARTGEPLLGSQALSGQRVVVELDSAQENGPAGRAEDLVFRPVGRAAAQPDGGC
jgi:hypothetical protein